MFTVLVLACTIDLESCKVFTTGYLHRTEDSCMKEAVYGIDALTKDGLVVTNWTCYKWSEPA